jgi:NADH-quinone oxidoreductase subunit I
MDPHASTDAPVKTADKPRVEVEDFHRPLVRPGNPPMLHEAQPAGLPLWARLRTAWTKLMIQLYVPSILGGLYQTFLYMVRPKSTLQYPEERHIPRKGYRGEHRLKKDDLGRPKCVACFMCATACPAECITIVAGEAPWPDRDKFPVRFEIDMLKCIYCGMCEEACPCDAIELTQTFTQVATSRAEKIYDKERLLSN